jgi:hypothetical protein
MGKQAPRLPGIGNVEYSVRVILHTGILGKAQVPNISYVSLQGLEEKPFLGVPKGLSRKAALKQVLDWMWEKHLHMTVSLCHQIQGPGERYLLGKWGDFCRTVTPFRSTGKQAEPLTARAL